MDEEAIQSEVNAKMSACLTKLKVAVEEGELDAYQKKYMALAFAMEMNLISVQEGIRLSLIILAEEAIQN